MKVRMSFAMFVAATALTAMPESALGQSLRDWRRLARDMVDQEIAAAGVKNERVLRAMRETPRHEFVPANQRHRAYYDMALPIGEAQTISPPFIVASMTEAIDPQPNDSVLEIGTGSGYQAAILSPLVREVYSIEIVESLGRRAARTLRRLGYKNVHTKVGDGYLGWPEAAPFDKIIVTCSPEKVPQPLVDQLREGGRMIVPVGERHQQVLYLFRKEGDELKSVALRPTLFVPMTGQAEDERKVKPDPKRPQIANGSFEEVLAESQQGDAPEPAGWHYQRQLKLVQDAASAPDGERYVEFRNTEAGRGAQALQGFAVDGRQVSKLILSFAARATNVQPDLATNQWPAVVIIFYGENRSVVGEEAVGPLAGTSDWQKHQRLLRVPLGAREAILRIGLLGGTGELALDNVKLAAVD